MSDDAVHGEIVPRGAPIGRPTDYDPIYCTMVVDHCRDGASLTSFAASIDVARSTIGNWGKAHPEFLEACARAKAKSAAWWETINRRLAVTGDGNQGACKLGLLNMGSEDWVDSSRVDLTSSDKSMSPKGLGAFYGESDKSEG